MDGTTSQPKPTPTAITKSMIVLIAAVAVLGLLAIIFIVLYSTKENKKTKCPPPPAPQDGPEFVDFVANNVNTYGDMKIPLGYNVSPSYFQNLPAYSAEKFKTYSIKERYDRLTAMVNQTIGISTYDASVWAICLCHHQKRDAIYWKTKAIQFLQYLAYASGLPTNEGSLISPREKVTTPSPDTAKAWVYNLTPATTTSLSFETLKVEDNVGYHFRNLPTNGFLVNVPAWTCSVGNKDFASSSVANQKINPAVYLGCANQPEGYTEVSQLSYSHSDYRPVSGENAWVLSASCDVYSNVSSDTALVLPYLANRLSNTMMMLESNKGKSGMLFYSPQRNNIDLWNVYAYSVENMASSIAALVKFSSTKWPPTVVASAAQGNALALAGRIGQRILTSHILKDFEYDDNNGKKIKITGFSVNQGGTMVPSVVAERVQGGVQASSPVGYTAGTLFAVDCFTWTISVMGDKIDAVAPGRCFELWTNCKKFGGYYENNVCMGLGYSFNSDANVHSSEWSIGGLFACQLMLTKLYSKDTSKAAVLRNDIILFEKMLQTQIVSDMNVSGKALLYCNTADYKIPFGWLGQKNPSMASTGWYVFWQQKRNPWRLDGQMDFVTFTLNPVTL